MPGCAAAAATHGGNFMFVKNARPIGKRVGAVDEAGASPASA